jgi:hypothetical protein
MTVLLRIAEKVVNCPLMILPDKLAVIVQVLDGRIGIDGKSLGDIEGEYLKQAPGASRFVGNYEPVDPKNPAAGRKPYRTTADGVAVIGVIGSLVNRGGWIGAYSGMTSYEGFKYQIGAAARDDSVSSILLDMDTPALRSGFGIAARASSSAPLSSDVRAIRSRSPPSALPRVASRSIDRSDLPDFAAVSLAKLSLLGPPTWRTFPRPRPVAPFFVSGCVASYAALRFETSFARCAGVKSRRIRASKPSPR